MNLILPVVLDTEFSQAAVVATLQQPQQPSVIIAPYAVRPGAEKHWMVSTPDPMEVQFLREVFHEWTPVGSWSHPDSPGTSVHSFLATGKVDDFIGFLAQIRLPRTAAPQ